MHAVTLIVIRRCCPRATKRTRRRVLTATERPVTCLEHVIYGYRSAVDFVHQWPEHHIKSNYMIYSLYLMCRVPPRLSVGPPRRRSWPGRSVQRPSARCTGHGRVQYRPDFIHGAQPQPTPYPRPWEPGGAGYVVLACSFEGRKGYPSTTEWT